MNICENCHSTRGNLYCNNCGTDYQDEHYDLDDFGGYSDCDGLIIDDYLTTHD